MRTAAAICRRLRGAMAFAGFAVVAACTASAGGAGAGSQQATRPPVAAASACQKAALSEPGTPPDKIVLGVIAIGDAPWPAVRVHQGRWRYWQKDGLDVLDGHQAVAITVPAAWRSRAAITWGANAGIASALRLPGTLLTPGCPAGPLRWNGYPGGFYLRSRSACVPLVFAVGRHSREVRIGVGRRCGSAP